MENFTQRFFVVGVGRKVLLEQCKRLFDNRLTILERMERILEHRTDILEQLKIILEDLIFIRTFTRILEHFQFY